MLHSTHIMFQSQNFKAYLFYIFYTPFKKASFILKCFRHFSLFLCSLHPFFHHPPASNTWLSLPYPSLRALRHQKDYLSHLCQLAQSSKPIRVTISDVWNTGVSSCLSPLSSSPFHLPHTHTHTYDFVYTLFLFLPLFRTQPFRKSYPSI